MAKNLKVTNLAIAILTALSITVASPVVANAETREIEVDVPKVELQEPEKENNDGLVQVVAVGTAAFIVGFAAGHTKRKKEQQGKVYKKEKKQ